MEILTILQDSSYSLQEGDFSTTIQIDKSKKYFKIINLGDVSSSIIIKEVR